MEAVLYKESIIQQKSFDFALEIIKIYKGHSKTSENILLKQLLRSATSIGANIQEASAGQTKRDFITKMSIASKEARETRYWIRLLKSSDYIPYNWNDRLSDLEEIIKILTKIVKTSQQKLAAI